MIGFTIHTEKYNNTETNITTTRVVITSNVHNLNLALTDKLVISKIYKRVGLVTDLIKFFHICCFVRGENKKN